MRGRLAAAKINVLHLAASFLLVLGGILNLAGEVRAGLGAVIAAIGAYWIAEAWARGEPGNGASVEELEGDVLGARLVRSAMAATADKIAVLRAAMGSGAIVATVEDMEVPESWPSVGCENAGHEESGDAGHEESGEDGWRCPDCGSVWWATNGDPQPAGYHVEAYLWRLWSGLTAEVEER